MEYSINYPSFFIATILEQEHLLKPYKLKEIVVNSLEFLVNNKRTKVSAFLIMSNHLNIIWLMMNEHQLAAVQNHI